jgi:hypothetical protein
VLEELLQGSHPLRQAFLVSGFLSGVLSCQTQRQAPSEQAEQREAAGDTPPPALLPFHGVGLLFESLEAFWQVIHAQSSCAAWWGGLNELISTMIHLGKDRVDAGGLLEDSLKAPQDAHGAGKAPQALAYLDMGIKEV